MPEWKRERKRINKPNGRSRTPRWIIGSTIVVTSLSPIYAHAETTYNVIPIEGINRISAINNSGVVSGAVVGDPNQAATWDYSFGVSNLGTLGGNSLATDINDAGISTGYTSISSRDSQSFIGDGDNLQLIDENAKSNNAAAINNAGHIVGYKTKDRACSFCSNNIAFLWTQENGTQELPTVRIGSDPNSGSFATAINDNGQITGYIFDFYSGAGFTRGFIWENGTTTALPQFVENRPRQTPTDINNKGQLVGYAGPTYSYQTGQQAFLYEEGITTLIGTSPSFAYAINESSQVVGSDSSGAFVWSLGTLEYLKDKLELEDGWTLSSVVDINDNGWIIGNGRHNGVNKSFLLVPGANDSVDTDGDGIGNAGDLDDDNDGMSDSWEEMYAFDPLDDSDALLDTDTDGLTNIEEYQAKTHPRLSDTDSDGVNDKEDELPLNPDEQLDNDKDGIGNNADLDDDNDQMPDQWELQYGLDPFSSSDATQDKDNDGWTNLTEFNEGTIPTEADTDSDGTLDGNDAFPLDGSEWVDTDNDSIGNNLDSDDDNDGMLDVWEMAFSLDPISSHDASEDSDGDGRNNLEEHAQHTDPLVADSPPTALRYNITEIVKPFNGRATDINDNGDVVGYLCFYCGQSTSAWVYSDENGVEYKPTAYKIFNHGINNSGQIVGSSGSNNWSFNPFIWDEINGAQSFLFSSGIAKKISNLGHVAGVSFGTPNRAFIWKEDEPTQYLGSLGGASDALDVNDHGIAVGQSYLETSLYHAFIYNSEEGMQDIGTLYPNDLGSSSALAINASNQVVGWSESNTGYPSAFTWDETNSMSSLTGLGYIAKAYDINDQGVIVGDGSKPGIGNRAIIWNDGAARDLNELIPTDSSWVLSSATGINNKGQIIGIGIFEGEKTVFRLDPIITTGDIQMDGDVDRDDLIILFAERNTDTSESTCGTACDLDGDGKITVLDARKLALLCTRPRCATE